jgi:hypothetical protein
LDRTSIFFARFQATSEALRMRLASSPVASSEEVSALVDQLDPVVRLTHQRPDLQWHLAHLLYSVRCTGKSAVEKLDDVIATKLAAWRQGVADEVFGRWADQALSVEIDAASALATARSATNEQLTLVR